MDFTAVDALLAPEMMGEASTFRRGQQIQLVCVGGARLGQSDTRALKDCHSP